MAHMSATGVPGGRGSARARAAAGASEPVGRVEVADGPSTSKREIDLLEGDSLESTAEHRVVVLGGTAAMFATVVAGFVRAAGHTSGLAVCAATLVVSYVLSGERATWQWGGCVGPVQRVKRGRGRSRRCLTSMTPPRPPAIPDLGTGVYHWIVDNYGDGTTPVLGRQIAAFQGHHLRPWTITEREFCNNVFLVFRPVFGLALIFATLSISPLVAGTASSALAAAAAALPVALAPVMATAVAVVRLAAGPLALSPVAAVFCGSFLWLICMSQQFHAWSHMRKSQTHPAVNWLQDRGLLIGRRAHGQHHLAPFEGNYCIVSGMWNGLLDRGAAGPDGDTKSGTGFFRRLERLVFAASGGRLSPRCWMSPEEFEEIGDAYYKPGTSLMASIMSD